MSFLTNLHVLRRPWQQSIFPAGTHNFPTTKLAVISIEKITRKEPQPLMIKPQAAVDAQLIAFDARDKRHCAITAHRSQLCTCYCCLWRRCGNFNWGLTERRQTQRRVDVIDSPIVINFNSVIFRLFSHRSLIAVRRLQAGSNNNTLSLSKRCYHIPQTVTMVL